LQEPCRESGDNRLGVEQALNQRVGNNRQRSADRGTPRDEYNRTKLVRDALLLGVIRVASA